MQKMKFSLIAVFAFLTSASSIACSEPKNGAGSDHDELIQMAEVIVIAELVSKEVHESGMITFFLSPLETLKGTKPEIIEFVIFGSPMSSDNDFRAHTEKKFWEEDIGRSKWPCCICGPAHDFEEKKKYLLFPDAFGAMKSAEVVNSYDDAWLEYVRQKLKNKKAYQGAAHNERKRSRES